MMILYSKPGCVQCNAIKRWLKSEHLVEGQDYEVVDLSLIPEAVDEVKQLGYEAVPVVLLPDGSHFYGFDSTKLEEWRAGL